MYKIYDKKTKTRQIKFEVRLTTHYPEACNFIKKETLVQVFSCEFCKISKNKNF